MTDTLPSTTSIACGDLAPRIAGGEAVDLLDVRTPAEFAAVHATGARLVPLDQLDAAAIARERAGVERPLYVLCKAGSRARMARDRLTRAGFTRAIVVQGGTDAWVAAGLPVVRGESKVMSLERQARIGAGLVVLTGLALGMLVHPGFLALSLFAGCGLVFAGVTDFCLMGLVLARMPWNRGGVAGCCSGPSCSIPRA